jgi:hypothetical protein
VQAIEARGVDVNRTLEVVREEQARADFVDKVVELYEKEGRMPSVNVKTEKNLYQQWNKGYKYNPSVVQALEARGVDVNRTLEVVREEQAQADFVDKVVELYKEESRMPSSNVKTKAYLYKQWNTKYKYNPSVVQALEARGVDVNRTLEAAREERARAFSAAPDNHPGRTPRMLDTRKASGEQLKPLSLKPRRIIDYASPVSVGTALLGGIFEKDTTNIFNPDGLNTPDSGRKHDRQYPAERNFTDQQAVETVVYADIRDLLRCVESKTNFHKTPSRRRTPHDPEIHNAAPELYKISDAEDFVLKLAELADKEDSGRLLDAYEASAAEPDNISKARALVSILRDLKIKYDENLQAAYWLVFSKNYKRISDCLDGLLDRTDRKSERYFMIKETALKLSVLKMCDIYEIRKDPNNYNSRAIRLIRINLLKLLPDLQREITVEAEELAGG